MEYYSPVEMNEVLTHAPTWMKLEKHAKWNKPDVKGQLLYDSIYIRHHTTEAT